MLIRYGFDIVLATAAPATVLTRLDVHSDERSKILDETPLLVTGATPLGAHTDLYGNQVRRYQTLPGETRFKLIGTLEDSGLHEAQLGGEPADALAALPTDVLTYLNGSRYCETDLLLETAWKLFGNIPAGAPRARAIVDFVHDHIEFGYKHARATRTAMDAFRERVGVCRDFAHLTVTLARCMNIPARYVNGYLGDIGVPQDPAPMDFSAWAELYVGGRWFTVDARHNEPRIGRIVIARGRDATDVPMLHTFGTHTLKQFTVVTEEVPGPARSTLAA